MTGSDDSSSGTVALLSAKTVVETKSDDVVLGGGKAKQEHSLHDLGGCR